MLNASRVNEHELITLPFGTRIYFQNTMEYENKEMKSRLAKLERENQDLKQTIAKVETKSKGNNLWGHIYLSVGRKFFLN